MLGSGAPANVCGVPPAVDKTGRDCEDEKKSEPAARSIEESFRVAFPPGQY